MNKLLSIFR